MIAAKSNSTDAAPITLITHVGLLKRWVWVDV